MNGFTKIAITCLIVCVGVLPAQAGETAFQEVAPNSHIRVISSDAQTDGTTLLGIEIKMPQSTKTYWRIPGETGIPLVLDASDSTGVTHTEILWPYPKRESTGGYLDFVYQGDTVLPVRVRVDGPAIFKAELILGICDEICVPVRISVNLPLDFNKRDLAQSLRITQAMADVPVLWPNDDEAIRSVVVAGGKIRVSYNPDHVDPGSIIVDTGDPGVLFSLPQKSPESEIVTFSSLGSAQLADLAGDEITVTFANKNGVFETHRIVQVAAD